MQARPAAASKNPLPLHAGSLRIVDIVVAAVVSGQQAVLAQERHACREWQRVFAPVARFAVRRRPPTPTAIGLEPPSGADRKCHPSASVWRTWAPPQRAPSRHSTAAQPAPPASVPPRMHTRIPRPPTGADGLVAHLQGEQALIGIGGHHNLGHLLSGLHGLQGWGRGRGLLDGLYECTPMYVRTPCACKRVALNISTLLLAQPPAQCPRCALH